MSIIVHALRLSQSFIKKRTRDIQIEVMIITFLLNLILQGLTLTAVSYTIDIEQFSLIADTQIEYKLFNYNVGFFHNLFTYKTPIK